MGMGQLTVSEEVVDWSRYEQVIRREAPSLGITEVTSYAPFNGGGDTYTDLRVGRPDVRGYDELLDYSGGSFGNVLVGASMLDLATPVDDDDLDAARRMLDQGGLVVFTSHAVDGDRVKVTGSVRNTGDGKLTQRIERVDLPAYFLQVRGNAPALAVALPGALDDTGLKASTAGLLLDAKDLDESAEADLDEAILGLNVNADFYVERGYQNDNETLILLGILFGLGAVLMLGGTLDGHLSRALRCAPRPGHALGCGGGAEDPARRGGGVRARGRLRRGSARGGRGVHPWHRHHLPADLDVVGAERPRRRGQRHPEPLRRHPLGDDPRPRGGAACW